jgi:hypothetical protein
VRWRKWCIIVDFDMRKRGSQSMGFDEEPVFSLRILTVLLLLPLQRGLQTPLRLTLAADCVAFMTAGSQEVEMLSAIDGMSQVDRKG